MENRRSRQTSTTGNGGDYLELMEDLPPEFKAGARSCIERFGMIEEKMEHGMHFTS